MIANDTRFTLENIEKAAANAQCMTSEDQQESIALINEWSEQPSSLKTSFQLIRQTSNFYTSFLSSSLIKNKIATYWNQIDINERQEYKESLITLIQSAPDIENNISYNLIRALCYIAVYEWPDEFPTFSEIIFYSGNDNRLLQISLRVLSTFMEEIEDTNIITDLHRNNLRQFIISKNLEKVKNIISIFLIVPELAVDVLKICNYMLRWSSTNDIIDFDLFEKITFQYLPNEVTCEKAVQCLQSIFLSRTDSAVAFRTFSPFLIHAISSGVFENQIPITTNEHVILFLLNFLYEYSSLFELVFIYNQSKEEQEIISFIDENVSLLVEMMEKKGISTETLHDDLLNIYQVILSIPPEQLIDEMETSYWKLWRQNLKRVIIEQTRKIGINASTSFYTPIYNKILQSLFNTLITSVDEEGRCTIAAQFSIAHLYDINPNVFMEFLKSQAPSPQLCYTIGILESYLEEKDLDSILMIIVELLQFANYNNSPEFITAFLIGISTTHKCFKSNHQLFSQFIDFICSSMASPEKMISDAAACSLELVVERNSDLFNVDCSYFIGLLIGQSEMYLRSMNSKSAIRIYKSCTMLISKNKENKTKIKKETNDSDIDTLENDFQNLYLKLFEPILTVLNQPNQFNQIQIETALDIIHECCTSSPSSASCLYDYIWPSLSQFAAIMIPNINLENSSLSYILSAISSFQFNLPYDQVTVQMNEVFKLMQQRQKIEDCFFEYFNDLHKIFKEMDTMYPALHENLIIPFLLSGEPLHSSMFKMIGQYNPDVVDIEWFTTIVIQALKDLRTEIGESALNAIQSLMEKLPNEHLVNYLNNIAPQLISVAIESIVDLMHKSLFTNLVEFLKFILNIADFRTDKDDSKTNMIFIVKNVILNSLKQFAPEPQEGFFDNFADYLLSVRDQTNKFKSALANLLVVLRKASPGDAELFKVEPVHQNSLFDMLFDVLLDAFMPKFHVLVFH